MTSAPAKRRFHGELDLLQDRLMEMAGLAEETVARSVEAFLNRDARVAAEVKEGDKRIDALEVEVDERVVELIALHQPMASDLRRIFTTLKIANHIERVGDHAHNIAKAARRLAPHRPLPEIPQLAELAVLSQRMLRDSLVAFGTRNSALAREVCIRDDRVDDMRRAVYEILVGIMGQDPGRIAPALEYIRVAQQLERIGDLSTNISEDVVFLVEGRTIKHHAERLGARDEG
jgi:phosphate transport system protein